MTQISANDSRITVVLLEPEIWRFLGMSQVLSSAGGIKVVGENGCRAVLEMKQPYPTPVDVVLLSQTLVRDFRLTVIQQVGEIFRDAKILVHGSEAPAKAIADLLGCGAKGFFSLSSEAGTLRDAIQVVASGSIWGPREAFAVLVDRAARSRTQSPLPSNELISPSEFRVLELLRDGLTNKEIAKELGTAEVTVKSHLGRMFRRFRVKTRIQLLTYAMAHELVLDRRSA